MKLTYRPEIDALRAIAVVGVVIYHAKVHFFNSLLFPGGYYGVDIFFIISGYLITGIIIKETDENSKFCWQHEPPHNSHRSAMFVCEKRLL